VALTYPKPGTRPKPQAHDGMPGTPRAVRSEPSQGRSSAETPPNMSVLPIHSRLICVPRLTNGYLNSRHSYSASLGG